jgi:hypothetical protein
MANICRKSTTRPIPDAAKITERIETTKMRHDNGTETIKARTVREASWRDRRGNGRVKGKIIKTVVITIDGVDRLLRKSKSYSIRYRNDDDIIVEAPTICRT